MTTDRDIALVKAALKAALYANEDEALDPAAIAATVPEIRLCLVCGRNGPCTDAPDACTFDPTPQEIYEENSRLRQRIAELEQENVICRDAIENAVDLVSGWCETHDGDSESACGRTALRRLSEAIGKATPRLMMERPEGQKFYGLRWKELYEENEKLRQRIAELERQLAESGGRK